LANGTALLFIPGRAVCPSSVSNKGVATLSSVLA
jgi:hypothetical protein